MHNNFSIPASAIAFAGKRYSFFWGSKSLFEEKGKKGPKRHRVFLGEGGTVTSYGYNTLYD